MLKTTIKELTLQAFQPYGSFANMLNPTTAHLGEPPIQFFRDMLPLDLGTATTASFSICRVETRPNIVDVTEYHNTCAEGILPLDGDVLIHVGPATPTGQLPLDAIEIFRVPQGTMVTLRPGVWHHAPFAHDTNVVNVLIVLPERTYAIDCAVHTLTDEQRIAVE